MNINIFIAHISEWMGVIAVAWILSLSPRFRVPQVGFRYARRDGIVALAMFGLLLVASFVYYNANPPEMRANFNFAPAPVNVLSQALWLSLMGIIPITVSMLVRRQPVRSSGWHPKVLWPAAQMGMAMALLVLFMRNRVWYVLEGVPADEMLALLLALGISLAEETVFRGYIQMRLVWWLGDWPGLALTSALFALWHMPAWLLSQQPLPSVLILLALTFGQGMVLGWIMRKSQNVLAPALYRTLSIWVQVIGS